MSYVKKRGEKEKAEKDEEEEEELENLQVRWQGDVGEMLGEYLDF
jgi:hypothetical protein